MIRSVTFEKTTYNALPYKFEAGTPHIAEGIGLGAALDYVQAIGLDTIGAYEHTLLAYATQRLPPCRACGLLARHRRRPVSSPSCAMGSIPTTLAPSSTWKVLPFVPAITVPNR